MAKKAKTKKKATPKKGPKFIVLSDTNWCDPELVSETGSDTKSQYRSLTAVDKAVEKCINCGDEGCESVKEYRVYQLVKIYKHERSPFVARNV